VRLIGYWIESLRDSEYHPPQEFVADSDAGVRRSVADYLDRGREYAAYRGTSWCRFFCDREMGGRELTDGAWVWPEDLGHYVRDHHIVLPDEFVRHALAGAPPLPRASWVEQRADPTYWVAWCRQHSAGRLRARIEAARTRADAASGRRVADEVAKIEAAEGVSDQSCQWAGCANRALAGRWLCAACCLRGQDRHIRMAPYFDLEPVLRGTGARAEPPQS
jgi:hypothetical protein